MGGPITRRLASITSSMHATAMARSSVVGMPARCTSAA